MRFSLRNKGPILFVLMLVALSVGLLAGDLTVDGQIESEGGGFVFPDGSVQTTAAGNGTPITRSGEWSASGMTITPSTMIVHDIFFYVESDNSPPCEFTMNYVISTSESRTVRKFVLGLNGSNEVHFESGIPAADLRFGTIGGGTCVRNWMATGFAPS